MRQHARPAIHNAHAAEVTACIDAAWDWLPMWGPCDQEAGQATRAEINMCSVHKCDVLGRGLVSIEQINLYMSQLLPHVHQLGRRNSCMLTYVNEGHAILAGLCPVLGMHWVSALRVLPPSLMAPLVSCLAVRDPFKDGDAEASVAQGSVSRWGNEGHDSAVLALCPPANNMGLLAYRNTAKHCRRPARSAPVVLNL